MSDGLFALRPASVQRQFSRQPVLLLSGQLLAEAAVRAETDCLAVQVDRVEVLPGILRAAEDLDVALWLHFRSFFDPAVASRDLTQLTGAVVALAERVRLQAPLVLSTEIELDDEDLNPEFVSTRLVELIEAGFTSFRFSMPGGAQSLQRSLAMMAPLQQLGLALELRDVPQGGAHKALEIFSLSGSIPSVVSEQDSLSGAWVVDGGLVSPEQSLLVSLPADRFIDMIARSLDLDRDEAAMAPLDAMTRNKVEALAYADTRSLVRRLGLIGSGSSCLAGLEWAL